MVLFTSRPLLTWGNLQVALSGISPRYLPAIYSQQLYPSVFYRHHAMTEYTFLAEKADRWGEDMASLWGNFNICPQLHQLELPCHSQAELFSISSLKVWGDAQKPHHNIAYLLVQVKDTKRDRHHPCMGAPQSSQDG